MHSLFRLCPHLAVKNLGSLKPIPAVLGLPELKRAIARNSLPGPAVQSENSIFAPEEVGDNEAYH
jgi:hypothetical protein